MAKRSKRGLVGLFPELGPEGFRERHWPTEGLVHHGDPQRVAELVDAPELLDIEGLIRGHDAIHALGVREDDGAFVQTPVSGRQGYDLYSLGSSLMLDRVERRAPVIAQWVDALAEDLGIERRGCYCQALLSPPGCVVPKHFDGVEVVIIQLQGEKHWRVGPNEDVRFPMWQWFPGRPLGPLRRIGASSYDDTPPNKRARMRPGSALFVPRGHWHQTETRRQASLSLSFIVPAPTWFELVMPRLRLRLLDDERWRAPQPYRMHGRGDAEAFAEHAQAMLEALGEQIRDIAPHELAPAMDLRLRANTRLVARASARIDVDATSVTVHSPGLLRPVTLAASTIPPQLGRWIAARDGAFAVRDATASHRDLPRAEVVHALEALMRQGYLQRHLP
ncbi:MAG: cupin domain-containing protein [Myxococcota bacterium]